MIKLNVFFYIFDVYIRNLNFFFVIWHDVFSRFCLTIVSHLIDVFRYSIFLLWFDAYCYSTISFLLFEIFNRYFCSMIFELFDVFVWWTNCCSTNLIWKFWYYSTFLIDKFNVIRQIVFENFVIFRRFNFWNCRYLTCLMNEYCFKQKTKRIVLLKIFNIWIRYIHVDCQNRSNFEIWILSNFNLKFWRFST